MGQELLKNLNEHEIGIEGFLGQYASQIVNNYFQHRMLLANLHIRPVFLFLPCRSAICKESHVPRCKSRLGLLAGKSRFFSLAGPGVLYFNEPK